MSKIMNGNLVFTYEEWIKNKIINNVQTHIPKCSMCNGDGEHECDCGDTHTCGSCNGTGDMDDQREIYERTLREEIMRLGAWINGDKTVHPLADKPVIEKTNVVKILISA